MIYGIVSGLTYGTTVTVAPAKALGYAHFMSIWDGRIGISLSAPGGGEGRGEVGDFGELAEAHLTFPRLRRGPLPLPPEGRRGISHRPREMCAYPSAKAGVQGQLLRPRRPWIPAFAGTTNRSDNALRILSSFWSAP
jgi:hypothetical protein